MRRPSRHIDKISSIETGIEAIEAACEHFFKDQVKAGKAEEAKNSLAELYSAIDKSQRKKAISRNAASRQKSRLTKHMNAALAGTHQT
jgi:ribosomal protein S20